MMVTVDLAAGESASTAVTVAESTATVTAGESAPATVAKAAPAPGAFITVEGGDGAGKTTHLEFIANHLRAAGREVTVSREPGGTALGEILRTVLLGQGDGDAAISARAELLLLFAARAQHIDQVIAPALAAGRWVVCDRFTDATYAYQGGGRGLDARDITVLEEWMQAGLQPDLTLLLDVPVAVGQARVRARGGGTGNATVASDSTITGDATVTDDSTVTDDATVTDNATVTDAAGDRFERESMAFKEAVREAYLARAAEFPARIKCINAAAELAEVQDQLRAELNAFHRRRQESSHERRR